MLTAVSLFAGIGGFDLACERSGIRVAAAVEKDPACCNMLRRHFPDVTLFSDVTEVTGEQLRAAGFVPGRGVVIAGWPCQGNSTAGRRSGLGDPRSGLWRHIVRVLAETSACWFIGENVPGLYSVNGGADIAVVRSDLAQLGYWWAERILDAQYFGVPQRRRRVFFAGHLGGTGTGPVSVLLEPESGTGNPAARGTPRTGTARAPSGGADDACTAGTPGTSGPTAYALTSRNSRNSREDTWVVHSLTSEGADASEDGTGRGTPLVATAFQGVRRLTPRECERLQGFPDGWTEWGTDAKGSKVMQSDSARYRQLGNAVAVPVAEWVLRRVAAVAEGG